MTQTKPPTEAAKHFASIARSPDDDLYDFYVEEYDKAGLRVAVEKLNLAWDQTEHGTLARLFIKQALAALTGESDE